MKQVKSVWLKYYRIFTALLPKRLNNKGKKLVLNIALEIKKAKKYFNNFILFYLVMAFFILVYFTAGFLKVFEEVKKERSEANKKFIYWKEIARNYSNFPIAYYNAAIFSLKLKNKSEAMRLLNKAIYLNPNFEEAIKLRDETVK